MPSRERPGKSRLFVSLNPPVGAIPDLQRLQGRLRGVAGSDLPVRWTPPDQFHLTLRFLGNVPGPKFDVVCRVLRDLAAALVPPEIVLAGFGCFPAFRSPRVLWVGVLPNPDLLRVQSQLETMLEEVSGLAAGEAFYPHLTLGRVRANPGQSDDRFALAGRLEALAEEPVRWRAGGFSLMESIPTENGSRYRSLFEASPSK